MTWISWKSMEVNQSPRDHWTTSRRSLQPQRKRVAFTASNTKSPVKLEENANKSPVIDIAPPKNYINIHWKFAGCGKTIDSFWNCLFPGDLLIFGYYVLGDFNSLQVLGGTKYPWLPMDSADLLLIVWPSQLSPDPKNPRKNPGRFLESLS